MISDKLEYKDFHDMRFDSIQVLRGIAAIFVVAEHIRFLACGAFGVDIFFCISGFMIMFSTHKSTNNFLKKRFVRIAPFYYLMTIFTYIMVLLIPTMFEHTTGGISNLIKSLLFIPFDVGQGHVQPLVRIGWTINCEMFFYLVFWISFHISHKYRGLICSIILSLIVLFPSLIAGLSHNKSLYDVIIFWANPIMLEFVLGIICYYLLRMIYEYFYTKQITIKPFIGWAVLIVSLTILFILAYHRKNYMVYGFDRTLLWGIPSMIVMTGFFIAGMSIKMNSWLVGLGNISFSIYLVHYYPTQFFDRILFDFSTARFDSIVIVVLMLGLIIFISYITHTVIEKKFTSFLLRKVYDKCHI